MFQKLRFSSCFLLVFFFGSAAIAQDYSKDKFRQLSEDLWTTPNNYRTGSGAPGPSYWQQQADYVINVVLDDEKQRITGDEIITYTNNSPDALEYLWLQLDQNLFSKNSNRFKTQTGEINQYTGTRQISNLLGEFDGGFVLDAVTDIAGKKLYYAINSTMMRVDLPAKLMPGQKFSFKVKWWFNINDRANIGGRSGMEYFEKDNNYLYTIAQFYPRMAVYTDYTGWQNKDFLGTGEFTLGFGNYKVSITLPADHIVAATGTLKNAANVLSIEQRNRFLKAQTAKEPVFIVTKEEALQAEKDKAKTTKTWVFEATNVRDFAFASSRKFIWDAMNVTIGGKNVLAQSVYPNEGNPLWEKYSTKVVAHTLKTYSKFTFDYPYPTAISVHAANIGMEYPMISFNGGRPNADGTYSQNTKYSMLGVIIHEVGHNFFPMIVNNDERQWNWMDEGLNTFLQYLTEQEWEHNYPSRNGPAYLITERMLKTKENQSPIMTNSDVAKQSHYAAYSKPATALNVLRETVMGRDLFDFAFKTYAKRWMFKTPTPEDFFRTMEDASAVDLDWFWRGWFYTTDHVDIALDGVSIFFMNDKDPEKEKEFQKEKEISEYISDIRNQNLPRYTDQDSTVRDMYNKFDKYSISDADHAAYRDFYNSLTAKERELYSKNFAFTQIKFKNMGGLISPIIVQLKFEDGSEKTFSIPAEIWRMNNEQVSKLFITEKRPVQIVLDPYLESADADVSNNAWPTRIVTDRFQLNKPVNR
ncbi:MAG TPA: aminopeptidase [Bacteroidales bacterium]|nr:aminopeptidase [Bacteroidales bacterium]